MPEAEADARSETRLGNEPGNSVRSQRAGREGTSHVGDVLLGGGVMMQCFFPECSKFLLINKWRTIHSSIFDDSLHLHYSSYKQPFCRHAPFSLSETIQIVTLPRKCTLLCPKSDVKLGLPLTVTKR